MVARDNRGRWRQYGDVKVIKEYAIPNNKELTLTPSKAEYRYKACPRCTGTTYKRPYVHYFACLVCGWEQQCFYCFGKVYMSGTDTKICANCGASSYVKVPNRGG